MGRRVMTDEDRWAIVCAPDDESTAALARRLNTPYQATYVFRAKVRRQGWTYALTRGTCDTCGEVLLIPPQSHGMKRHRGCKPEHTRQRQRRRRKEDARFREVVYDRARDRQDALQETTSGLDTNRRQRWTIEDDDYLWEHRHEVYTRDGIARLARVLGRSYAACQRRLTRLTH